MNHITIICPIFNEEDLLPHFVAHYRSQGATEIVLLDNGSDDRTLDIAREAGLTIEAYETEGLDDWVMCEVCMGRRKKVKSGWVITPSVDEFISPLDGTQTIAEVLDGIPADVDILGCWGWEVVERSCPGSTLVERHRWGFRNASYGKPVIMRPTWGGSLSLGFHTVAGEMPKNVPFNMRHFNYFHREIFLKRRMKMVERVSASNRARGLGIHYFNQTEETLLRQYDMAQRNWTEQLIK